MLLKLMKFATDHFVQLEAKTGGDLMWLRFRTEDESVPDAEFEFPLMDLTSEQFTVPATTYDSECLAVAAEIKTKLSACKDMGDNITIRANRNEIQFSPDSTVKSVIRHKGCTMMMAEGVDCVECTFATKHLMCFMKGCVLSDKIIISMSEHKPALFQFKVGKMGRFKYYVAPKIMDDEGSKKARVEGE
jgi:proliferating cell nuclear antigen